MPSEKVRLGKLLGFMVSEIGNALVLLLACLEAKWFEIHFVVWHMWIRSRASEAGHQMQKNDLKDWSLFYSSFRKFHVIIIRKICCLQVYIYSSYSILWLFIVSKFVMHDIVFVGVLRWKEQCRLWIIMLTCLSNDVFW